MRGVGTVSMAALVLLAGCVGVRPSLLDDRTSAFQPSADLPPVATPGDWWKALDDPTLDALVADALANNFTIQAAAVRLEEAKGLDTATVWSLLPTGSASQRASNTRVRSYQPEGLAFASPPTGGHSTSTGSFAVSWELPLFGKANAISDQGSAQQRQSYWSLEAAKLTVASELVRTYSELRGTSATSKALSKSVELLTALVTAEQSVMTAGVSTQAEVNQLLSRLNDQRTELVRSQGHESQLLAKIDALLGTSEGSAATLAATPPPSFQGLPAVTAMSANSLRARPDIRAAEEGVALAAARAGIAVASLWPQFSLGGELSITTGNLDSTGTTRGHSDILNTSAGLKIPLLDWFALKADAVAKQKELQAVTLDYRQTVVQGWEEARSAYIDYTVAQSRLRNSESTLKLARQEANRQAEFVAAGIGNKQGQLHAELALADKEASLASDRFSGLQAWAKLVKATFAAKALPLPLPQSPSLWTLQAR